MKRIHNPAAARGHGVHVLFLSAGSASDGSVGLRVLQTVRTEPAGRTVPNAVLGRLTVHALGHEGARDFGYSCRSQLSRPKDGQALPGYSVLSLGRGHCG